MVYPFASPVSTVSGQVSLRKRNLLVTSQFSPDAMRMDNRGSIYSRQRSPVSPRIFYRSFLTMNATQEQLDVLFPTPSPSPTGIAPSRFPGYDCRTTETLLELLKDNHKRWHIFFNDMGFHKSVAFAVLQFTFTYSQHVMLAILLIICFRSTLWVPTVLHSAPRTSLM